MTPLRLVPNEPKTMQDCNPAYCFIPTPPAASFPLPRVFIPTPPGRIPSHSPGGSFPLPREFAPIPLGVRPHSPGHPSSLALFFPTRRASLGSQSLMQDPYRTPQKIHGLPIPTVLGNRSGSTPTRSCTAPSPKLSHPFTPHRPPSPCPTPTSVRGAMSESGVPSCRYAGQALHLPASHPFRAVPWISRTCKTVGLVWKWNEDVWKPFALVVALRRG